MINDIPIPDDEKERLAALHSYHILDTQPEDQFDDIIRLASIICNVPIALIGLIDDKRQWFKSCIGLEGSETKRELTFCQHAILGNEILHVSDARQDVRFAENPSVTGDPHVRFYAGAPLTTADGYNLGTLCVIDKTPRRLTEEEKTALNILAQQVMAQFELRKQKEELLNEKLHSDYTRNLLQSLIDKTTSIITLKDTNGKILMINEQYLSLIGLPREKVLNHTHYDLFPKELAERFRLMEDKVIASKEGLVVQHDVPLANGVRTFLTNLFPLFDAAHNVFSVASVSADITKQKELEKQLIIAKELAEEASSIKGRFLENMSHEIRTPMNAIVGFTELLGKTKLDKKQKDYVETISSSGKNLMVIINDILDYSKIDAGMMSFEKTNVSIHGIFNSLSLLFAPAIKEKKLKIAFTIDKEIPGAVTGDPTRLTQVVTNLLGNAIKFTSKGSITVHAKLISKSETGARIAISVTDTGIGIPRNKLQSIFDRFNQASNDTTRKYGGTGLGLSIVKSIAELQGGSVNVKSTLGKGSEFIVEIPFEISAATDKTIAPKKTAAKNKLKGFSVLLVEDNAVNQKLVKIMLDELGLKTEMANDGKLGVEKLKAKKFDLVLMDMQMPVMDGYEATGIIRKKLKNNIPIIAMTASALDGEREKCISAGMNEYISKPVSATEVYEKMSKLLLGNEDAGKEAGSKSKPAAPAKNKVLSLDYLNKLMNGNRKVIGELIDLFVEDTPVTFALLKKAVDDKDRPAIRSLSHNLKSSLLPFGMQATASPLLEALEKQSPDTNFSEIKKLFSQFSKLYATALGEAKNEQLNYR